MDYRNTLLFNALSLPRYWSDCQKARKKMKVTEEKIFYGKKSRQYFLCLRGESPVPGKYAFYFHGGAWTFGKPETFTPAALPWLQRGYTVILPSYRRPPVVGLNRIVADCREAIAAVSPPMPVTHLHVGGISAGAHLAALLALKPEWWQAAGWSASPQKALLCAGPLVLGNLWPQIIFGRYQQLDPWSNLSPAAPSLQWLLLHGTGDATVPYSHSVRFTEKLVQLGQSAHLLTLPNGTHLDAGRWMFAGLGADEVSNFIG